MEDHFGKVLMTKTRNNRRGGVKRLFFYKKGIIKCLLFSRRHY
jgi:hypothetical protein